MSSLLSVQEVSEFLGISDKMARGLIKAGTIKSVIIGKRHKVKPSDLDQYLKLNGYEPIRVFMPKKRGRPFKTA